MFTSMAGDTEVTLHEPPEMRSSEVTAYAARQMELKASEGPTNVNISVLPVITPDGQDIGGNRIFNALLIASTKPGSMVPK